MCHLLPVLITLWSPFFPHSTAEAPAALAPAAALPTAPDAARVVGWSPADEVRERIRARIEAGGDVPGALVADGERIHARAALTRFYEERGFEPAWVGDDGPLAIADELVSALRVAEGDGLHPDDYHASRISAAIQGARRRAATGRAPDPGSQADLELLATDGFLLLASHLSLGRVDPESLDPKWVANRRDFDGVAALRRGLEQGVAGTLASFRPGQDGYRELRTAYRRYRDLAAAGGWSPVPEGPRLEAGPRDPRVAALRARLVATGELPPDAAVAEDPERFDENVDRAVRAFQRRHGLGVDGVVGPATLAALNVPAAERARQIRLNLERWRWLPAELGRRHVLVNAANFELDLVEDGRQVFTSRVVVGKPYRRTPAFTDRITYVVLSPYWHVPHSLAIQDQVPAQRRDPGYFARVGMRVFRGWGDDAAEIDPATIDWNRPWGGSFPYRLRQDPGPQNFLGGVKIMFPNRFNVYLHDTPARELFERSRRDFSSGCIRVENALELTELLLREVPGWDMARIRRSAERGREETVRLPAGVPVHLLYSTAWADPDGTVHFRQDIYDRDPPLAAALGVPPPEPGALLSPVEGREGAGPAMTPTRDEREARGR